MNTHPRIIHFVAYLLGINTTIYLATLCYCVLLHVEPPQAALQAMAHVGDTLAGAFVGLLINTRQSHTVEDSNITKTQETVITTETKP